MQTLELAPFFDTSSGFGTAAVIDGRDVLVIFDQQYREAIMGEGSFSINEIVAHLRTSDLGAIGQNSTAVINASTYKVRELEPHVMGITLLRLEKQ